MLEAAGPAACNKARANEQLLSRQVLQKPYLHALWVG